MRLIKIICVGLFLYSLPTIAQTQKPNVLFILIDDFGWKDVGYNGSTFYETPEIDKLAKEWMRFDNCYTPSPMCSPTRTSIITGKNPARHGITQWLPGIDRPYTRVVEKPTVYCPVPQSQGISASEFTLGEAFTEAGYETAFYGKWHMGKFKETGGPIKHGYNSQKAVIEQNGCTMFYPFRKNSYFPKAKEGDNYTDLITKSAIDFVTTKRDKPFYLHLCHFAMHYPIATRPSLRSKFEAKAKKLGIVSETGQDEYSHQPHKINQDSPVYAGELYNLDRNIGLLIDALKESGQYENTIIVFTGDNGGRSTTNKSNATALQPLRAGKTFVFEGGLKTPLLIHAPGKKLAGKSSSTPVTSMDFYPTLLELAGLPLVPEQHVDGTSLVPLLKNKKIKRDTFYWHFPHYQGEGSYPASAIRVGDLKLIHNYHFNDVLLFDVVKDPYEKDNLALKLPKKAAALDKQLMNWLTETGAYIPKKVSKDYKPKKKHKKRKKHDK
jgi:arylsulfatase A-like enzyme